MDPNCTFNIIMAKCYLYNQGQVLNFEVKHSYFQLQFLHSFQTQKRSGLLCIPVFITDTCTISKKKLVTNNQRTKQKIAFEESYI